MKTATTLIVVSTVIHLLGYLLPQAMPEHLLDLNWPEHARFHMWQATIWLITLDLMILLIALFPFRHMQPWSYWALLAGLLGSQVGYFVASAIEPDGRPDTQGADVALLVLMLLYVSGLVLGWRQLNKS